MWMILMMDKLIIWSALINSRIHKQVKEKKQFGIISYQFLPLCDSIVPRYVMQLLFSEKTHKQPLKQEKISTILDSFEF